MLQIHAMRQPPFTPIIFTISMIILLYSCENTNTVPPSTWETLHSEILEPNCVSCHTEGTVMAKQSQLVLSLDVAYKQLVEVLPENTAAKQDGLVRVSSEGGMKGIGKSYLLEKINAYDSEHFLSDHPEYGNLMPPGGNFLTDGALKFIRMWIEAGAPEIGNVADESLLLDSNKYVPPEFEPLTPPEN